jgi:hypothetical protein
MRQSLLAIEFLPVYAMQVLEALESAHPGMWSAYSAVLYGEPTPQVSALT